MSFGHDLPASAIPFFYKAATIRVEVNGRANAMIEVAGYKEICFYRGDKDMRRYAPSPLWRALRAIIIGLLLSVSMIVSTTRAQQLTMEISIEEATLVQGAILVAGTVTCSEPTAFTDVSVEVRQPVGRFKSIRGFASDSLGPCTDELPFELLVAPDSGSFKSGTAFVFASTFACDVNFNFCDGDADSGVFTVRR